MRAGLRQFLSALAVVALVALLLGGAASTALALREQQASVVDLTEQLAGLDAREHRLEPRAGRNPNASPFFEARTVTIAGAALQQRLEAAVSTAHGRMVSSKVDVAPREDEHRVTLSAELTIAQPEMQTLLYDLETGRPYLFVDAIEVRAPEAASEAMRVSLTVSGQWSVTK